MGWWGGGLGGCGGGLGGWRAVTIDRAKLYCCCFGGVGALLL